MGNAVKGNVDSGLQYSVSHGADCFGSLEQAIARKEQIAMLAPGSFVRILDRVLVLQKKPSDQKGEMYVQVATVLSDGARSVMWCRWSPFTEHLYTKGKELDAVIKLQVMRKIRMGLRRTRAIANAIDSFWQEGWSWEIAATQIQRAFKVFQNRQRIQDIAIRRSLQNCYSQPLTLGRLQARRRDAHRESRASSPPPECDGHSVSDRASIRASIRERASAKLEISCAEPVVHLQAGDVKNVAYVECDGKTPVQQMAHKNSSLDVAALADMERWSVTSVNERASIRASIREQNPDEV